MSADNVFDSSFWVKCRARFFVTLYLLQWGWLLEVDRMGGGEEEEEREAEDERKRGRGGGK